MNKPQVSSPSIVTLVVVIGSKEILSTFSAIVPSAKELSVTVGIVDVLSGNKVPT